MVKIVIKAVGMPNSRRPDILIRWFCEAFGLSDNEEGNGIEFTILRNLAYAAYENRGYSSMELKEQVDIGRSTIVYHLNKFIEAGLVVKRGRRYYLRSTAMSGAIEEIEYDLNKEMMKLLDAAKEFDRMMESSIKKGKREALNERIEGKVIMGDDIVGEEKVKERKILGKKK